MATSSSDGFTDALSRPPALAGEVLHPQRGCPHRDPEARPQGVGRWWIAGVWTLAGVILFPGDPDTPTCLPPPSTTLSRGLGVYPRTVLVGPPDISIMERLAEDEAQSTSSVFNQKRHVSFSFIIFPLKLFWCSPLSSSLHLYPLLFNLTRRLEVIL